jgi:hypothetical protein
LFPIPQGFVGAEDEETAVHQPRGEAPGDLPLHGLGETGEDQIAAEDQVERAGMAQRICCYRKRAEARCSGLIPKASPTRSTAARQGSGRSRGLLAG